MPFVYWPEERLPCGYQQDEHSVRCSGRVEVVVMGRGELYDEGPQGGLRCEFGHQRYVWPSECKVVDREQMADRPEQLWLW